MSDTVTPKILQNVPVGKDEFASQSQDHIAESIKKLILNIDNEESSIRLIGIEGGWGTGKSNLVKILEDKLSDEDYSFFLYDAWGHQEDLHRRAIIEELSDFVAEQKICTAYTANLNQIKEETLGTEIITNTIQNPDFSWAFFFLMVSLICFSANNFVKDIYFNLSFYLGIISIGAIGLSFFIIIFQSLRQAKGICSFFSNFKNKTLQIYNKKEEKNTTMKRINQLNPSSKSFESFLQVIDKGLNNHKLVIVIDNIDRMNKDKVKDIWATIHMCFSSAAELHNILVLVPFDKNKIRDAFYQEKVDESSSANDSDEEDNHNNTGKINKLALVDDFIQKTFSLVFRVSLPVLSDWEEFFRKRWTAAFKSVQDEIEFDYVKRIFDAFTEVITPRNIIAFINEFATIKLSGVDNQIKSRYIAIFIKKQNYILSNITDALTKFDYLKPLDYLVNQDGGDEYFKSIASLIYQVPLDKGLQVALSRPLKQALENQDTNEVERISANPNFDSMLGEVLNHINNMGNAVIALSQLSQDKFQNEDIYQNRWDDIFSRIMNWDKGRAYHEVMDYQLILLDKITQEKKITYTKEIVENLYSISNEEFDPNVFSDNIDRLDFIIKKYQINVFELLRERKCSINQYKTFMSSGKHLCNYKLVCDTKQINDYLAQYPLENISDINYIKELLKCQYDLSEYKTFLEQQVVNTTSYDSFKGFIGVLKQFPGVVKLENLAWGTYASIFSQADKQNNFYYDLVAIGYSHFSYSQLNGLGNFLSSNEEEQKRLIEPVRSVILDYISSAGLFMQLVDDSGLGNSEFYKAICHALIASNCKITEIRILPHLKMIEDVLGIQFNQWEAAFNDLPVADISDDAIISSLPIDVLKEIQTVPNSKLYDHCKSRIKSYLDTKDTGSWKSVINNDLNTYDIQVGLLISYQWPSRAYEAVKAYLKEKAENRQTPTDIEKWHNFIGVLKKSGHELAQLVCDIYGIFLKSSIDAPSFKFWISFFDEYIFKKEGPKKDTLRCIFPVILLDDGECLKWMNDHSRTISTIYDAAEIQQSDFYRALMERATGDNVNPAAKRLAVRMNFLPSDVLKKNLQS